MNSMHRGLLTLLRSAITGEKLSLPEGFQLQQALSLIDRQSLHTLAYLGAVNCGLSKTDPLVQQLYQQYLRAMLHSERQLQAVRALFAAFEENNIDYMPLKGCNLKLLYPQPELRVMGDADILIRTQQYEKIIPVMQRLGYAAGEETSHELPWKSPALYVELHKRMIPPEWKAYCAYYGDGWQRAVPQQGSRYAYTAEDEYIFIFCHFAKHFRHRGVGCRPLLDLWVYRRSHPVMDEAYITTQLTMLELAGFHRTVLHLLETWLNDGAADEKDEFITEYIFSGGSWGSLEKALLSREAHLSQYTGKKAKNSGLHAVLEAAFPPAKTIADRYPVLKKAPWLLPVVWPWRWVDAALFRRGKVRAKLDALNGVSNDSVAQFRSALEELGLPFEE